MGTLFVRRLMMMGVVLSVAAVGMAACASAATEKTIRTKVLTVRPSGKRAKFAVVTRGTTAYIVLSVKKGAHYVELDRDKVSKPFRAGSKIVHFSPGQGGQSYSRNGGQGLLAFSGPDPDNSSQGFAGYFGWNITKKSIEFF